MTEEIRCHLRIAEKADMARLTEIYAYYVEETNVTFEYVAPTVEEFTGRYEQIIKKYPYVVAEVDGTIMGYAYANTFKARTAYDWGVETTVYLDKDFQGHGVGGALYIELEKHLKKQNILNLYASVTYPYPLSIDFHEKMGYRKIAHLKNSGYKFGKWHDMTWMEKNIGDHLDDMPNVIWFEEYRVGENI